MKMLIVEDDNELQTALHKGFTKLGYNTHCADDGEEALDIYFSNSYNIIILDLNIPKIDGMDVLHEIRSENKDIPILILSARSEIESKVLGLDNGANDYLSKPFNFKELEARIRALLRRKYTTVDTVIEIGSVKIDTAKKRVCLNSKEIALSKKEYSILEYLALNKGITATSFEITRHLWESDSDECINSFKVQMGTLRKKLPDGTIKNSRGYGYYVE